MVVIRTRFCECWRGRGKKGESCRLTEIFLRHTLLQMGTKRRWASPQAFGNFQIFGTKCTVFPLFTLWGLDSGVATLPDDKCQNIDLKDCFCSLSPRSSRLSVTHWSCGKKPPLLTSNMSKHVKFHFCGIFFIGGYQLGEWVCWNVEGRVKMSPSLISWRRTPPHHSCHPFHMALIRLTSTTPHSLGIGHSPVDLNIHTSFHCEWVHKYNQLFGPVSVWVEIKFQLDLSPGSKCSR